MGTGTFGVSGQSKSVVKHGIWGLGKMGGPILMIYISYDVFLHKQLPFGVAMIAPVLNF